MPKPDVDTKRKREDRYNRLAQVARANLYGGLAGVGIGGTVAHAPIQRTLANLAYRKSPPLDIEGLPVAFSSWDMHKKIKALAKAMNVDDYSTIVAPFDAMLDLAKIHRETEALKKIPVVGKKISDKAKALFGVDDSFKNVKPIAFVRGKSPAITAHEFGHAKQRLPLLLDLLSRSPGAKVIGASAATGAILSENETLQNIAPALAVAPIAPMLLSEAEASARGTAGVARVFGKAEAAKGLLRLLPAFATYLAEAAPLLAAPLVAKAIKDHIQEKNAEFKMKITPPKQPKATGRKIKSARQEWSTPPPKPKTSILGKPGRDPDKPPSKSKYYKDMLGLLSGLGTRS